MKNNIHLYDYDDAVRAECSSGFCGVDEAGRGPLAGPVYAAAVILPPGLFIAGLDDSKKLTAKTRERLFDEICEKADDYAAAFADVNEIAEKNILGATYLAMNRAIAGLRIVPTLSLIDGPRFSGIEYACRAVTGGDGKSASIAAASVIAKVTRDRYMRGLAAKYPIYGFERNKGYGTAQHRDAIIKYGPSPEHRPLFLRKIRASAEENA